MIRPTLSTHSQQAQVPPGRGRLPWTVVLPWAITGAILVGTALYAFVPTKIESNPAAPGESGALVWGDGLFTNPLELQAWLRIRGVSYKEWAQKHPAGVKLLAPQPVPLAKKPKVARRSRPEAQPSPQYPLPSRRRAWLALPPRRVLEQMRRRPPTGSFPRCSHVRVRPRSSCSDSACRRSGAGRGSTRTASAASGASGATPGSASWPWASASSSRCSSAEQSRRLSIRLTSRGLCLKRVDARLRWLVVGRLAAREPADSGIRSVRGAQRRAPT